MRQIRVAVVTTHGPDGAVGGAEKLYDGLVAALNFDFVRAENVAVLVDERTIEGIWNAYLKCYDLDLSEFDAVISTKAPSFAVRHPNHVCYLVHTMRVFYDMFDSEFPQPNEELMRQRSLIQKIDTLAFDAIPSMRRFCIGHEVARRQMRYNRCAMKVLHPPLVRDSLVFQSANEPFAFIPGRLHRWKRIDLLVSALRRCSTPMRLVVAGTGEDENALRHLADDDPRIEFLGRVSEEELVNLYSRARIVPFVPIREDYGYVTIEAFKSGKPVLTCVDSGEPTHFVVDGQTGFVCRPDAAEIAEKLDWCFEHPNECEQMGRVACESVSGLTWSRTRTSLLAALGY